MSAQLLHSLVPHLAGRVTLAQFTAIALALGLVDPRPDPLDLVEILQEERGNVSAAARRLKVCTKTIYRRLAARGVVLDALRPSIGPS